MYQIPCECGNVYIGQTRRSLEAGCKEHMWDICLGKSEKSVVAEHSINIGHHIDFSSIPKLHKAAGYMKCLVKEGN